MTHAKIGLVAFFILLQLKLICADGLPGEYLLSDKWRQVFANQSPVDNPAIIMEEPYLKVRGAVSFSSGDPARLWELGATMPLGLYQAVGLSILAENGNDVVGYIFQNQNLQKAATSTNNNFLLMGSYAINPWGKLSIGSNLNLAYQSNFGEPGWGFGADLGVSYRIVNHPDFGYHIVGLTYRNLFSPKVSASTDMPFSAQIKAQYHANFFQNRMSVDYQICMSDLNSTAAHFLENKKFDWDMELQLGVSPIPYLKLMAFTDISQWNDLGSFGLVFGVDLPNLNKGKDLAFYYQFRQNMQSDLLGSHSLYGSAQLGRHREELYAIRLMNKGQYAFNNLYTRAMRNYYDQNYWDAYFAFSRLLADYPTFFKNDAVAFFAASCLEFLDMRSAALQAYKKVKEKYSQSSYAAQADLGILRLYYRNENYEQVKRQYEEISGSDASDSIKQHAAYYMGETEIILGNYKQAASVFELVAEDHSLYSFAQHSLATVHVFLNSGNREVEKHLLNAINGPEAKTSAQKEIINRSLILLGYLYYEEKAMAKAVTALRMIPKESYYYEDAQLGLGWAAVKSRQWQDCIDVGKQIETVSKKKIIQSEGQLLQAYGYLLQKNYTIAEKYLKMASKTMEEYKVAGSDVSKKQALQYDSIRITYDSLADEITKIAQLNLTKITDENVMGGLHEKQKILKQNIDLNIRNADEHKRIRFFEKAFLKLREDLEYALVTVLRIRREIQQKNEPKQNTNSPDNKIDGLESK